ncbi:L-lactate dehydrogenase [Anaerobacterium chartisolvens]|uniref:L-lactate dehydrogenase n=1 Tax=Anaerobacterium chartisolvens TaxID=1297424 RepID=A0A369BEP0_9FIRM|nr:L-lactate dehydrogenase [Anaerobacterium chartisolvens]RCX19999.1 L-lactate dehydrogenase [Anaerobacterium chartisolvens]
MNDKTINKIAIIGAGFVGSTTAYTLMLSGLISEIVLIDKNTAKAEGEAMDLNHGMPFVSPVKIYTGDYSGCAGADIVIITAGANQKPGETRMDLVHKNTTIFKDIIREVVKHNKECILLVVTNPVDILTYVTYKISGFPADRVLGSGTVLDTARFRYLLSEHISLDTRNVHGYIIGEHGDTEVPAWSLTNIAGIPMDNYCNDFNICSDSLSKNDIYENVKNAAYNIIERKGATYYAVALAVRRIVEAIVRDESSILTVSSLLDGQYGLKDICLSVPTVVNKKGIDRILDISLSEYESEQLARSGQALKNILKQLDL